MNSRLTCGQPTVDTSILRDRARGLLVGAALGDAFGAPFEGSSPRALGPILRRRAECPTTWGFTDDTMMLIAVAECLRDAGTIDPVALLHSLSNRYEPARGFGRGMKLAIEAFNRGTPWHEVARAAWPEGSRGNGGAVRAAAVALRPWCTRDDLHAAASASSRVTHAHEEVVGAAAVLARFVDMALHEPALVEERDTALGAVSAELATGTFGAGLVARVRSLVSDPESDIAASCGTSSLAAESVAAALTTFFRSHATFQDAIIAAATLGGDVDSICAMVGALAGAFHGLDALPESWRAAIQHESPSIAELCDLADAIASLPPIPFAGDTRPTEDVRSSRAPRS